VLTLAPGSWTGSPSPTLAYRWQRCSSSDTSVCVNISGERGLTYLVSDQDRGFLLRAVVVGTNNQGTTAVATETVGAVPFPPPPPPPPTPPFPTPTKTKVHRHGYAGFKVTCPQTGRPRCHVAGAVIGTPPRFGGRGFARAGGLPLALATVGGGVPAGKSKVFRFHLTRGARRMIAAGVGTSARAIVRVNFQRRLRFSLRVGPGTAERFEQRPPGLHPK
jgi:hypothetical protein